jgi:hypothetical protein
MKGEGKIRESDRERGEKRHIKIEVKRRGDERRERGRESHDRRKKIDG